MTLVITTKNVGDLVVTLRDPCGRIFFNERFSGRDAAALCLYEKEFFLSIRPLDRNFYGVYRYIKVVDDVSELFVSALFRQKTTFSIEKFDLKDKKYGLPVKKAELRFVEAKV